MFEYLVGCGVRQEWCAMSLGEIVIYIVIGILLIGATALRIVGKMALRKTLNDISEEDHKSGE